MSDQPIHPAVMRVVRSLQEMSMQSDPFCCASEASEYAESLLREFKEAGLVDLKWENARRWINDLAEELDIYQPELMEAAEAWVGWGEKTPTTYYSIDHAVFRSKLPEFWDNYEIVTGTIVPPEKRTESFFADSDEEE